MDSIPSTVIPKAFKDLVIAVSLYGTRARTGASMSILPVSPRCCASVQTVNK